VEGGEHRVAIALDKHVRNVRRSKEIRGLQQRRRNGNPLRRDGPSANGKRAHLDRATMSSLPFPRLVSLGQDGEQAQAGSALAGHLALAA
jgi:hypothetical protein